MRVLQRYIHIFMIALALLALGNFLVFMFNYSRDISANGFQKTSSYVPSELLATGDILEKYKKDNFILLKNTSGVKYIELEWNKFNYPQSLSSKLVQNRENYEFSSNVVYLIEDTSLLKQSDLDNFEILNETLLNNHLLILKENG